MGVNVGDEFLGLVERFLYCRVGSVPFTDKCSKVTYLMC